MKIQIIDGEVTEVTQQDWQAFEAWRKEQAKDWPQGGDRYYTITEIGGVALRTACFMGNTQKVISIGNIYRTEAEALAQVEKLKAKARIDKYIADNGLAFVPDWGNPANGKKVISYHHQDKRWFVSHTSFLEFAVAGPYFAAEAHAQQVIDNCTDDLKTLFGVK